MLRNTDRKVRMPVRAAARLGGLDIASVFSHLLIDKLHGRIKFQRLKGVTVCADQFLLILPGRFLSRLCHSIFRGLVAVKALAPAIGRICRLIVGA